VFSTSVFSAKASFKDLQKLRHRQRLSAENNSKMYREIDFENWNRRNLYEYFKDYDDPFFNITVNFDVTEIYHFCKTEKIPFSLASLYSSLETANSIREFKIRLLNGKLVEFDEIQATQTILQEDETFSFCYFEIRPNLREFAEIGKRQIAKYKALNTFDVEKDRVDLIYYSVNPWFSFTSFKHARKFDKTDTIPKIVFGQYFKEGKNLKMPISIEVNHAIMDGLHVGKFCSLLQDKFNNPI
jgi:chloramphenicol O-acetyltransferase type A